MRSTSNDKIIQILKCLDEVLYKSGLCQYQERIHRISKTLLSIEKHNNCFVSRFSIEHKNEECIPEDISDFNEETESNQKDIQTMGLDGILEYIEEELHISCFVDESTLSSSSDEETSCKVSFNNLHKKFGKIELRLIDYLRSANQIFKFNFDSLIESKQRTPMHKSKS